MSWPNCSGVKASEAIGRPLTLHFLLADNGDGVMPLLTALAGREDFPVSAPVVRGQEDGALITLRGTALRSADGRFDGYEVEIDRPEGGCGSGSAPCSIRPWTKPCARRSTGSSPPPSGSSTEARGRCAAIMPPMPAISPPLGRHLLSVIRTMTEQEASKAVSRTGGSGRSGRRGNPTGSGTAAEERSVQIEFVGGDQPLMAAGERRGAVQILVNLLGNAVRHSPERHTSP